MENVFRGCTKVGYRREKGCRGTEKVLFQCPNPSLKQIWQYGVVRHVYEKLLVDINYDGGETSRCIPSFEIWPTAA